MASNTHNVSGFGVIVLLVLTGQAVNGFLVTGSTQDCNFESGICGYQSKLGQKLSWRRRAVFYRSAFPHSDHTRFNSTGGHILYTAGSSTNNIGDTAKIATPEMYFPPGQTVSVGFWVAGTGSVPFTLMVFIHGSRSGSGSQYHHSESSSMWKHVCLTTTVSGNVSVMFDAMFMGSGSQRPELAIDDIHISSGYRCPSSTHTTASTESTAPVDGHWGSWSAYGHCTVTCGKGTLTYHRVCNNPVPARGGHQCAGTNLKFQTCSMSSSQCTVNGDWSTWTTWSKCTTSCDMGVITRQRSCDHPTPSGGGHSCTGNSKETHDCSMGPCPTWSHWFNGTCSVTCGNGTMERVRQCSTGNNADCTGGGFELLPCEGWECIRK